MAKAQPRRVFRLSENEVRFLQSILGRIGGAPEGPRGIADGLWERLTTTFGLLEKLPIREVPGQFASIYFQDTYDR